MTIETNGQTQASQAPQEHPPLSVIPYSLDLAGLPPQFANVPVNLDPSAGTCSLTELYLGENGQPMVTLFCPSHMGYITTEARAISPVSNEKKRNDQTGLAAAQAQDTMRNLTGFFLALSAGIITWEDLNSLLPSIAQTHGEKLASIFSSLINNLEAHVEGAGSNPEHPIYRTSPTPPTNSEKQGEAAKAALEKKTSRFTSQMARLREMQERLAQEEGKSSPFNGGFELYEYDENGIRPVKVDGAESIFDLIAQTLRSTPSRG